MSQEERLMILQMVADKKISASEAADLLKALDQKEEVAAAGTAEPVSPRRVSGPSRAPGFGSTLSSFIEEVVERVTSAVSDLAEPRYEFPQVLAGNFAGDEIPLRIATGNGRVEVRTWDEPGFKADVLVKARGGSEAEARNRAHEAYTVNAGEQGFDLEVRRTDWTDVAVHVTLLVPVDRRYRLEVRTGNGAIEIGDLPLVVGQITTGNGRVTCRGGQSDKLMIRSGNGSLEIETDAADLEAGSGNGSVTVLPAGSRPQLLQLRTGNGSIRVGSNRVGTGAGFKVEAQTGMGSVTLSLPFLTYDRDQRSPGHKHVVARTNNFETAAVPVTIAAKTGMGSIIVE